MRTNLGLILSCLYSQLQKLWLRTCQVSSGRHAAVCIGVCYHQAYKCFPSWRPETSCIFTDSYKPPPQWTHLQRQQVEYRFIYCPQTFISSINSQQLCICHVIHKDNVHFTALSEPGDTDSSEGLVSSVSSCQRTPIYKPFTQCRHPIDCPPHPAPHSITDEELHFVKTCLQRWRTEVENDINGMFMQILIKYTLTLLLTQCSKMQSN